jgi:hypothetical protein
MDINWAPRPLSNRLCLPAEAWVFWQMRRRLLLKLLEFDQCF